MTRYRFKALALSTLALGGLMVGGLGVATVPLWAQQTSDVRGIQLNFGVQVGLETQSNRTLDPGNANRSSEATVDLSLGLLSETRTQRFSFNLGGELRSQTGSGAGGDGFHNPSLALAYSRNSAAARLSLSASARESDLTDDAFVFDEETLEFTFVEGDATRRNTNLSAQLNWRDDAPLGFGVLARYQDNSYRGGVATGIGGTALNDTQRLTLGATVRFDINEATRLNTSLTYSKFEEDGAANARDTWTFGNNLTVEAPRGSLTFGLDFTNTEDGTRVAARVGRSLEYPLGVVSGQFGLTRGITGETFLNGGLTLTRALPLGSLSLALARNVTSGSLDDSEQITTSVNFGYRHELTPLSNLSVNATWAQAQQTATGIDTLNASITATYSRELITDWNMNVGVRHRFRDDDDLSGTARSNEVFLNLRRNFLTRF